MAPSPTVEATLGPRRPGQHVTPGIQRYGIGEPVGARGRADEDEQLRSLQGTLLTGLVVRHHDDLQRLVAEQFSHCSVLQGCG